VITSGEKLKKKTLKNYAMPKAEKRKNKIESDYSRSWAYVNKSKNRNKKLFQKEKKENWKKKLY